MLHSLTAAVFLTLITLILKLPSGPNNCTFLCRGIIGIYVQLQLIDFLACWVKVVYWFGQSFYGLLSSCQFHFCKSKSANRSLSLFLLTAFLSPHLLLQPPQASCRWWNDGLLVRDVPSSESSCLVVGEKVISINRPKLLLSQADRSSACSLLLSG